MNALRFQITIINPAPGPIPAVLIEASGSGGPPLAGVELTGSILSSTSAYWAPCVGLVSVGGIRLNFTNAISCGTTYPTIEATTLNGPVTINPIDGTSAWTYSVDSQSQTYLNIVGDPTYGQLVGNSIILGGLTGIVQANGTNKATVATNVLQASNEVSVTPVASFSGGGGSFNQTNTGHYEQDVNGHTVTAIGSLSIQAASLGTGLLLVNVAPVNSAANSTYQPCTLWFAVVVDCGHNSQPRQHRIRLDQPSERGRAGRAKRLQRRNDQHADAGVLLSVYHPIKSSAR
jgi:hypothetical protein